MGLTGSLLIKSFHQQNTPLVGVNDVRFCSIYTRLAREAHGQVFGESVVEQIVVSREFGQPFCAIVRDKGFWSRSANRLPPVEVICPFIGQRQGLFQFYSSSQSLNLLDRR